MEKIEKLLDGLLDKLLIFLSIPIHVRSFRKFMDMTKSYDHGEIYIQLMINPITDDDDLDNIQGYRYMLEFCSKGANKRIVTYTEEVSFRGSEPTLLLICYNKKLRKEKRLHREHKERVLLRAGRCLDMLRKEIPNAFVKVLGKDGKEISLSDYQLIKVIVDTTTAVA